MLRKLLRWGRITKAGPDTGQFPIQQTEYLGKAADAVIVLPYGFHANVPSDALALLLSIQGNPDNRAAIPLSVKQRPQLAEGDVAFFHPATGAYMVWKNGVLEVHGPVVFKGSVTFEGSMTHGGKDISSTHGHTQANDSGGDTEQPISGVT